MTPVLEYEQPLHVERCGLPRFLARSLLVCGVMLACVPLVEAVLLGMRMGTVLFLLSAIGPIVGAAVLSGVSSASLITAVFSDRLQIALVIAGARLWSKCVPLATLAEVEIVKNPHRWGRLVEVLHRSLGRLSVMFSGKGLRLRLLGGMIYCLGSDDPDALAAAIALAKEGTSRPATR